MCVFEANASPGSGILAALFPPAKAEEHAQHDNRTSDEIYQRLGHRKFNWIDLFPFSPKRRAKDAPQSDMREYIEGRSPGALLLVKDWWSRIQLLIAHEIKMQRRFVPVVWVAGRTCQRAFELVQALGLVEGPAGDRHVVGSVRVTNFLRFVIVEAQHPSAHLMVHDPNTKADFGLACAIFGLLGRQEPLERLDDEMVRLAEVRRQRILEIAITLDLPHKDGWIETPWRHLRNIDDETLKALKTLKEQLGQSVFLEFCRNSMIHVKPETVARIVKWHKLLGDVAFKKFMTAGVTARLQDTVFFAELDHWLAVLGKKHFVSFMCNSVAARLCDDSFRAELDRWLAVLGNAKFVSFMCNSVAARLCDDSFRAELDRWLAVLGKKHFVSFMCNSVAARLCDDSFRAELDRWLAVLGNAKFVSFMCNIVAARLVNAEFMARLDAWYEYFGVDDFVSYLEFESVAARLHLFGAFIPFQRETFNLHWTRQIWTALCHQVPLEQIDLVPRHMFADQIQLAFTRQGVLVPARTMLDAGVVAAVVAVFRPFLTNWCTQVHDDDANAKLKRRYLLQTFDNIVLDNLAHTYKKMHGAVPPATDQDAWISAHLTEKIQKVSH